VPLEEEKYDVNKKKKLKKKRREREREEGEGRDFQRKIIREEEQTVFKY
jgi:hypothetical protein